MTFKNYIIDNEFLIFEIFFIEPDKLYWNTWYNHYCQIEIWPVKYITFYTRCLQKGLT